MNSKQILAVIASILTGFFGAPVFAEQAKEPYVQVAEIEVDPTQLASYRDAVREQIEAAIRLEPGVLVLYAISEKDNPAHIKVFEIYRDVEAYQAHLQSAHFKKYKVAT